MVYGLENHEMEPELGRFGICDQPIPRSDSLTESCCPDSMATESLGLWDPE